MFERRFLAAAATGTISGTVYHDVDGDGNLAGASTFAGALVRLFRDGGDGSANGVDDVFVTSTTTGGAGSYSFGGLANATYFVVVDSKTLSADPIWAEQTYGAAGSALGAGFTLASGVLYGGRNALASDNSTNAPTSLATSEHVMRVNLAAAGVTGVDSGFSFNAITSARDGRRRCLSPQRPGEPAPVHSERQRDP